MELPIDKVTDNVYDKIKDIGPFGEGFESPVFFAKRLKVESDRKTDKNHHIMVLSDENDTRIPAVKWFGDDYSYAGKLINITYRINKNNYKDTSTLQLNLDYILENNEDSICSFSGRFWEGRTSDIREILEKHNNALVFYEGLGVRCPIPDTVDRYNLKKTETLIFLTPPASTNIFREVISLASPDNIIVNFSAPADYSFSGFLKNLMGLIKYIINKQNSKTNVELLASKLCSEEALVFAGLKYLKILGKINYFVYSDNRIICFSTEIKTSKENIKNIERGLKNALMEKEAYRDFIMKLPIEQFIEYLK